MRDGASQHLSRAREHMSAAEAAFDAALGMEAPHVELGRGLVYLRNAAYETLQAMESQSIETKATKGVLQ